MKAYGRSVDIARRILHHGTRWGDWSAESRRLYTVHRETVCILTPLSGQLEAALRLKPAAGPPLSVEKIIIESLSIPRSASAATTSPTHSSNLDNIPV